VRRPDLDDKQGRLGELRAADLVHADHYQIGIELGLRAELDGRLGRGDPRPSIGRLGLGALESCRDRQR
jgi:hypothetical protein